MNYSLSGVGLGHSLASRIAVSMISPGPAVKFTHPGVIVNKQGDELLSEVMPDVKHDK